MVNPKTKARITIRRNPDGYQDKHYLTLLAQAFGNTARNDDFPRALETLPYRFVVFDDDTGEPVGIACCCNAIFNGIGMQAQKPCLYIGYFGIVNSHHGGGYGSGFMETLTKWAKDHSYPGVVLEVNVANEPAVKLYERAGFQKYYYMDGYYQKDYKKANKDAYIMYLDFMS